MNTQEPSAERVEALTRALDALIDADPDRAERLIESQLARLALRKRHAANRAADAAAQAQQFPQPRQQSKPCPECHLQPGERCDVCGAVEAAQAQAEAVPVDMVLHCPACGLQHIDAPEPLFESEPGAAQWSNPPHRSHFCHGCGHIWRPADVPTNGVAAVKTTGKADSPITHPAPQAQELPASTGEQRYSPDGEGGMEVDSLGGWVKYQPPPPAGVTAANEGNSK